MLTLVNFLAALIASWVILYATYGLTLLAVHSVWWMVGLVSSVIVYATFGVTLLVVHSVRWMLRAIARLSRATSRDICRARSDQSASATRLLSSAGM